MTQTHKDNDADVHGNYDYVNLTGDPVVKHSALSVLLDPRLKPAMSHTTWIRALLDPGL